MVVCELQIVYILCQSTKAIRKTFNYPTWEKGFDVQLYFVFTIRTKDVCIGNLCLTVLMMISINCCPIIYLLDSNFVLYLLYVYVSSIEFSTYFKGDEKVRSL